MPNSICFFIHDSLFDVGQSKLALKSEANLQQAPDIPTSHSPQAEIPEPSDETPMTPWPHHPPVIKQRIPARATIAVPTMINTRPSTCSPSRDDAGRCSRSARMR
jgi:hypothetical protein